MDGQNPGRIPCKYQTMVSIRGARRAYNVLLKSIYLFPPWLYGESITSGHIIFFLARELTPASNKLCFFVSPPRRTSYRQQIAGRSGDLLRPGPVAGRGVSAAAQRLLGPQEDPGAVLHLRGAGLLSASQLEIRLLAEGVVS